MKKFVALVVLSCAVMFSSTAAAEDYFLAANSRTDGKIPLSAIITDNREQAEKKA